MHWTLNGAHNWKRTTHKHAHLLQVLFSSFWKRQFLQLQIHIFVHIGNSGVDFFIPVEVRKKRSGAWTKNFLPVIDEHQWETQNCVLSNQSKIVRENVILFSHNVKYNTGFTSIETSRQEKQQWTAPIYCFVKFAQENQMNRHNNTHHSALFFFFMHRRFLLGARQVHGQGQDDKSVVYEQPDVIPIIQPSSGHPVGDITVNQHSTCEYEYDAGLCHVMYEESRHVAQGTASQDDGIHVQGYFSSRHVCDECFAILRTFYHHVRGGK